MRPLDPDVSVYRQAALGGASFRAGRNVAKTSLGYAREGHTRQRQAPLPRWPAVFELSVRIESISDPGLRHEVARICRVIFQLLSQLADEHPQIFGMVLRRLAPHRLEQLSMLDDAVRVARQVDEEMELLRCQPHFLLLNVDAPAFEVDAERTELERLLDRVVGGSPQQGPGASEQLAGPIRLD